MEGEKNRSPNSDASPCHPNPFNGASHSRSFAFIRG